jgi:hypothetical protein
MIGISWAMVVANVFVNVKNGQRLSVDDYGWLLNGIIVGTLSIAPTALLSFAGYHWRLGGKKLAWLAGIVAAFLVALNLWCASEYVGDQMLGRHERLAADQQLAETSNVEVMRSKREAEDRLWKAWGAAKNPAERAEIYKQLKDVRSEVPSLRASIDGNTPGARAGWLNKHLGWSKDVINGITPTAIPVAMQMVELVFGFIGFSAWPRTQVVEPSSMFGNVRVEFQSGHRRKFIYEDAVRDITQLKATGELDTMNLSKAACARRWHVARSTAWEWLQKMRAQGLIMSVPSGEGNATAIRTVNGSGVKYATRTIDPITALTAASKTKVEQ